MAENRRHARQAANWRARCFSEDGTVWNVIIIDRSDGGFGLDRLVPMDVDARLHIAVADVGTFPCRIAWKSEERCGLQLLPEQGSLSENQILGVTNRLDHV